MLTPAITAASTSALRVFAEAAATPAAAPARRKSRLLIFFIPPPSFFSQLQGFEHPLVRVYGDRLRPGFEFEVEGLLAPGDLDDLAARVVAVFELDVERHAEGRARLRLPDSERETFRRLVPPHGGCVR